MLQHLHAGNNIETSCVFSRNLFDAFKSVLYFQALLLSMFLGDLKRGLREVDAHHLGTGFGKRLRKDAASATHVQYFWIAHREAFRDEFYSKRVDRMEGSHFSLGIPPGLRYSVEFLNFFAVNIFNGCHVLSRSTLRVI